MLVYLSPTRVKTSARNNRAALRAATHQIHAETEASWPSVGSTAFPVPRFLASMHGVHLRFGLAAGHKIGLPDITALEKDRIAALTHDLALLSETPSAGTSDFLPSKDFAWGVLYALNGSALGATVLLRDASAAANCPTAYLSVMRDYVQTGRLGAFFRALNDQNLKMADAEAGARAVFASLKLSAQKDNSACRKH